MRAIWKYHARLERAWELIPEEQRLALVHAGKRIQAYAEKQKIESWSFSETDGSVLGQQVSPLDRVGLYVPGQGCLPIIGADECHSGEGGWRA